MNKTKTPHVTVPAYYGREDHLDPYDRPERPNVRRQNLSGVRLG